jgi:hypothetical protein
MLHYEGLPRALGSLSTPGLSAAKRDVLVNIESAMCLLDVTRQDLLHCAPGDGAFALAQRQQLPGSLAAPPRQL